jgi:hypothetical protein
VASGQALNLSVVQHYHTTDMWEEICVTALAEHYFTTELHCLLQCTNFNILQSIRIASGPYVGARANIQTFSHWTFSNIQSFDI